MSTKLVLVLLTGLIIAAVAATDGFSQVPGPDPDNCPDVQGTASGCPDKDSDGISDAQDLCPDEASDRGTDVNGDGCPEPISVLNYRYRLTRKPGLRLTSLKLDIITQASITARCRGCRGAPRRRGRSLVFRVTRKRLRPGKVIKITTHHPVMTAATECFRLRVTRRSGPRLKVRRAITLGVPSVNC